MATIQDAVCLSLLTGAPELFLPVRVNVSEQHCTHHYKSASMQTRCSYSVVQEWITLSSGQIAIMWIVPTCTFLQCMINLTRGIPSHFHHIHLNQEFFKVLIMWKAFLVRWNGHSFFLDTTVTPLQGLGIIYQCRQLDGLGGYCNGQ